MSIPTIPMPAPQFFLHPLEPIKNVRMTQEIKVPHEIFHRILDFIPTQSLFLIQQVNRNWLHTFAHYLIPRAATTISKRMFAVLAFNADPRHARCADHKKIMRSDPYLSVLAYHKQIDHLVPLLNADIFYDKDTRKIIISDIALQYLK